MALPSPADLRRTYDPLLACPTPRAWIQTRRARAHPLRATRRGIHRKPLKSSSGGMSGAPPKWPTKPGIKRVAPPRNRSSTLAMRLRASPAESSAKHDLRRPDSRTNRSRTCRSTASAPATCSSRWCHHRWSWCRSAACSRRPSGSHSLIRAWRCPGPRLWLGKERLGVGVFALRAECVGCDRAGAHEP